MNTRYLELSKRLAALPLDKQQLFRQKLADQGIDSWSLPIVPFIAQSNHSSSNKENSEHDVKAAALGQKNKLAAYPLSLAQQRFLVAESMSDRALYNLCSILHFDDGLHIDVLQQSIKYLVQRHDILQTKYQQNEHGLWQAVCLKEDSSDSSHNNTFKINIHSSALKNSSEIEQWCQSEYEKQLSKPFDLSKELPFRVDLYSHSLNKGEASKGFWLFFTIHHIAFDAWSAGQLIKELAIIYRMLHENLSVNIADVLPALSIQYQDYAAWQHQWLTGDAYYKQQQYWKKQLQDLPEPLELPRDYRYKENHQRNYEGAIETYQLNHTLSQHIRRAVKEQGTTLYTYLQTAFSFLLTKYTGQSDFCLGTSVTNRDKAELSDLIGPLLNTVVIRHRLDDNATFEQALKQAQKVVVAAFDNKDYPFEHLTKVLAKEHTSPLFSILFVHIALPDSLAIELPKTNIQLLQAKQKHARFDLTVRITESPENISLELEYATELFSQKTIQQWLSHANNILEQVSQNPTVSLSNIALSEHLSILEGKQLIKPAVLLTDKVNDWAKQQPETIALEEFNDGQIRPVSYQHLVQKTNSLSAYLNKEAFNKGDIVALCMNRSSQQMALLLACWQLGLVTVMLDPRQSRSQLQKVIDDAQPTILFVDKRVDDFHVNNIQKMNHQQISTQQLVKQVALSPVFLREAYQQNNDLTVNYPALKRDDPAYIIYTSGSTGIPKGVVIHHGAVSHYAAAITQQLTEYQVTSQGDKHSRWLTLATVAADLGLTSIFAALYLGHRVVLPNIELAFNPPALADFLSAYPIDYLKIVPSHLKGLLSVENPEKILPQKALLLGGEGLAATLYQHIKTLDPNLTIINHYGPSETTVGVSSCMLAKAPNKNAASQVAPLGTALPEMHLEVRNSKGVVVPNGVTGELYIAGAQVSAGYWQRPEQTHNAFLLEDKQRYYKSGDLVRVNQLGQLEFLGRVDDQIKRRGYRLELGEVTAWLNLQAEISQASVDVFYQEVDEGVDKEINKQHLLAFIELSENNRTEKIQQKIKQRMRDVLPNYMIPDHFIVVDSMPLNNNGKVNRQQLLQYFIERDTTHTTVNNNENSKTAIENQLAQLWSELLNIDVDDIKPSDDFFALGGDSILSLQLIAMAKKQNLLLKPTDIIRHSCLATMAGLLDNTQVNTNTKKINSTVYDKEHSTIQDTLIKLFTELLIQGDQHSLEDSINKDSDFFRCGGDSILSLQLIARAHKAGIRLTPKMLMQKPTPSTLARLILDTSPPSNKVPDEANKPLSSDIFPSIPLLSDSERAQPQPLSASQQRIWFLQQFDPESTAYNVTQLFNVTGNINFDAFTRSVEQLVGKHEILRCRFFEHNTKEKQEDIPEEANQVFQQLVAMAEFNTPLHIHRLNNESKKTWASEIKQASHKVFQLDKADVFSIDLFECRKNHYQLLINLHHIVTDGWSMSLLVKDFIQYYQGFISETSSNKKTTKSKQASYLDWVANNTRTTIKGNKEALSDYWLKRLKGVNQTITLPVDKAYPAIQSSDGKIKTLSFNHQLTSSIDKLAQAHQTTPFTVLLAAYKILLWRYSGETDFAVGIPVSGRENPDTQAMVGVFINTVASRHNIRPQEIFSNWLTLVHKANVDDFAHQALAIENVFDLLGLERQLARASLFQTIFNYQSDTNNQRVLTLPELELTPVAQENVSAKYELSFNIFKQEALSLQIEFNSQLFEDNTIDRLATDYQHLLEQLCQNPKSAIDTYELPSMLQPDASHMEKAVTANDDFITRFEKAVDKYPEKIAIVANDKSLSYEQLNRAANQLAHWLIEQGAEPEQLIAFCLPRDSRLLITLLAIQKAGAAYLPLDPSHPVERLRYIIEHAQASLCLCESTVMPQFASAFSITDSSTDKNTTDKKMPLIDIDTVFNNFLDDTLYKNKSIKANDVNPKINIKPQNLAYVLYTSGSTGKPKGVQLERRQFANFLRAIDEILPTFSSVLALTTITFDIAGLELCLPLVKGASVILASDTARTDSDEISRLISENSIDLIQATPAGWRLLHDISPHILNNVTALAGGEALDTQLADFLSKTCKQAINVYGPTETTVWSTSYPLASHENQAGSVPIGQPILNNQCFVLDEHLQKVPTGVVGELYIGGQGLARGYQYKAALTADKFIPSPFNKGGERLYKTGDQVKWLANGELYFVGRNDHQVKLRGLRIELGEVETSLLSHKDISQTVVVVKNDQLIAYIVLEQPHCGDINNNDNAFNNTVFNSYLSTLLPEYMLPQRYQILDAMPLNSNGKIDRNALPELSQTQLKTSSTRKLTEKETIIATIWQSLLSVDNIHPSDSFFELGGHSLLAVQVRARLQEQGFLLPLKTLFEYPVLSLLAQELNTANNNNSASVIEKASREEFMPLSSAQQRLWFMQSMKPMDTSFNMSNVLELTGAIDYTLLQTAVDAVVARHEILRTTYHDISGQAFQKVHTHLTVKVQILEKQTNEQFLQTADTVFDLSKEAPLKVYLYKIQKDEHICQLVQHHIASDGWSTIVLMNDLIAAYELAKKQETINTQEPVALPKLAVQYIDYAIWQNAQLERQQQDIDYWRTNLSGVPPQLALPFTKKDINTSKTDEYAGDAVDFTLSAELTRQIKRLAKDNQCSLFMVLMAALSAQLHHHTRSQDIVIGTDVANRQQAESEALIGFFVNLVAIRNRPKPTQRFSDYLQQTRDVCINSLDHQQLPFDKVVEAVKPTRIKGVHPIIQALLVVQNMPLSHRYMDDIRVSQRQNPQKHAKFDMALFVDERINEELSDQKEILSIRWVFRTKLFERSAIEFLSTDLQRLLHAISDKPSNTLAALSPKEKGKPMVHASTTDNSIEKPIKRKMNKLSKIKTLKSNKANTKPQAVIKTSELIAGKPFPLLVQSTEPELDPFNWAEKNQAQIIKWLEIHGGILFRGFNLASPVDFEKFCQAMYPELYGKYGDLPKKEAGEKIYKSTPYPNNKMIMFHNESSHQYRWPRRQWFYCEKPSATGGATPIVDCREMYAKLPQAIRKKLEEKKLRYTRNFSGLDVSWQHFFKTEDRTEVEDICHKGNIQFEWYGDDNLRISEICPAVIKHPVTGDMSFFNQIQLHHYSFLEASVRDQLLRTGGEKNLPRNVYYGDGEPLEPLLIDLISELYEECAVRFKWQQGDVVMVDNMLAAHARDPFEGERKMVVAMGDIHYRKDVDTANNEVATEELI